MAWVCLKRHQLCVSQPHGQETARGSLGFLRRRKGTKELLTGQGGAQLRFILNSDFFLFFVLFFFSFFFSCLFVFDKVSFSLG